MEKKERLKRFRLIMKAKSYRTLTPNQFEILTILMYADKPLKAEDFPISIHPVAEKNKAVIANLVSKLKVKYQKFKYFEIKTEKDGYILTIKEEVI
jgi:hypothetical protein